MNILLIFPGFILAFIIVFYYERKIRELKELSVKPKDNVHFYVARDKNSELFLYLGKPFRGIDRFHKYQSGCMIIDDINFSSFGLNKNDYADIKWEDEPVEVFLNLED